MDWRTWRWSVAFGLALWLASATVVLARQAGGLLLDKRPSANSVISGNQLSLILTLVNNGADELNDLVVTDVTPPGTVFFAAAGPPSWAITTPDQNATGKIVWRNTAPLSPGRSAELRLLVTVRPETEGTLLSQGFSAQVTGWDQPLISPAVAVTVLKPTAPPAPAPAEPEANYMLPWLIVGSLAVATTVALVLLVGLQHRARVQQRLKVRDL